MTASVAFSDQKKTRPTETVSGLLDVREKTAYLRRSGYLPGERDVRVPLGQLTHYRLRHGDHVVATTQAPYDRLTGVSAVNGSTEWRDRPRFADLTPVHPRERLRLETDSPATRLLDLLAPVGKGQRGLIVAPPKVGKTLVLQAIAAAISHNHPDCHLMVVLVGERPEEVTEMRETVHGEVAASTFDRADREHTQVAELAIERAKRLVEGGRDVVVLLDSLTRLARAYNNISPANGRVLAGGIEAAALLPPRRFFGAARAAREGGSLTILATALVDNGSRMDDNLFEEFKGTGNMEIRLRRDLAERRIYPAVDVAATSTRREELLLHPDERAVSWQLRRTLAALDSHQATELLLAKIAETGSNAEFLAQVRAA